MSEQTPDERRRRKGRSPSYPGIALGEAIEKAEVLYEKEGRHAAPTDVITTHWGYRPKTGPGLVAVAALKKFGLLEDEEGNGARRSRLTPLALSIVLDEAGSPERQQRIREAALTPPIHAELWNESGGRLPSDQNLRRTLVLERGFTDSGAQQFIRQFKSTIAFARLDESDKMPEAQPSVYREHVGVVANARTGSVDTLLPAGTTARSGATFSVDSPQAPATAGSVKVTFPLAVNMETSLWPVLQVPIPMTEEAWEQMLRAIDVLKVGVVRNATGADDPPSTQPQTASEDATE